MVPYRDKLDKIRLAFPQPVSDRVHDSYFVHSIMRALDLVDSLKSEVPVLGPRQPLDYGAAERARLPDRMSSVEEVTSYLVSYFEGLTIWGHPRTQINVVPPPSISSLIATLLTGLYNPNLAWDEYSHKLALAEAEAVAISAALMGYDPAHASTCVLNRDNFGTVTLFRAYPDGVDTFSIKDQEMTNEAFRDALLRHTDYNRKIYDYVHAEAMAGRGVVISLTDSYRESSYGEPVTALKSFILSPFTDEANVEAVVEKVLEARAKISS